MIAAHLHASPPPPRRIRHTSRGTARHGAIAWSCLALAAGVFAGNVTAAADYVIQISVDGLNAEMMQSVIDDNDAPNLKRFQDEGAWTNNARTDVTRTITLPNHATMITGRPVTQVAGFPTTVHHGYTQNDIPPSTETLHNAGNPALSYIASTFDVVHDAGRSTAFYSAKTKFSVFDRSYNSTNGAPHPNGADKIDRFYAFNHSSPPYSASSHSKFITEMAANHYRYTFIHYADTDDAGHADGWGSDEWNSALGDVDDYLADVFDLVETDPVLAGKTTIILTADHGGTGTAHSAASDPDNFTIPFFVWGAGVAHGDLYALNAGVRFDPGGTQPTYNEANQPIRNGDSGNLALRLLGLGPVPGSLINAAQDLRLHLPGDFSLDGIVDAADYTVWRNKLGNPYTIAHYLEWKANYGTSLGSGAGGISIPPAHVPEPTSLFPQIVGCALVYRFRRRRRGE